MLNQSLKEKYQTRRKRALEKSVFKNMALLLPPSLLIAALLMVSLYTYGVSLLLTYFILPMFYTVERRLRFDLTHIGKKDFNYGDGYKAFFQSNKVTTFLPSFTVTVGVFAVPS